MNAKAVEIDYVGILDVMGAENMTTNEIKDKAGLKREATLIRLHAAHADGYVELTETSSGCFLWRKRS